MGDGPSPYAGRRFGVYEIVERLGAGGMGVVYRARDTKLGRDVAIKILPPEFNRDAESRARFDREARMLAALNHPHVATIHDVVEVDGQPALVLELLEGPTLAERLQRGPLPADEAAVLARQIAAALAAAHAKGIVHRDLKPGNVQFTATGAVKVLDFGLAKQSSRALSGGWSEASTTVAAPEVTRDGTILGTVAYMSPEQARGRPVDARADIWAFGCVVFELLTGRRAFERDTASDTLAAVLEHDPPWEALPAAVSPAIRRLLRRCLDKDPARRLADIGEARALLEESGARWRPQPARWLAGVAAAGGAIAIVIWAFDALTPPPSDTSPIIRSVAVLPLVDLSPSPDGEYFTDGMTDELIAALAKVRAWRVISRTSVMQYKASTKPLPVIAKELGVDAFVEGTVQRVGDRVRISVRLLRVTGAEESLWEQNYDRELRDVLDLEAEVARSIVRQIRLTLTPFEERRLAGGRPVDPVALQLYLRGKAAANIGTEEAIVRGIAYFEEAVRRAPAFAAAHAAMALAYGNLTPAYRAPKDVLPKSREHAKRAIELDDTQAEAYTALAGVMFRYDWDWTGAAREIRRAIDLNPSSADAHELYGNYLVAVGKHDDAIAELQLARVLSPTSLVTYSSLLAAYVTGRAYDDAIAESRRAIAAHPEFAFAHAWLGMALVLKGQVAEAIPALDTARRLDENVTTVHFLAMAHAAAGNAGEARRLAGGLAKAADDRYTCAYEVGSVFARLGDTETAFKWIERGFEERCDCMVWLTTEPWMDPLRVDPRYADLVRRVGFPR